VVRLQRAKAHELCLAAATGHLEEVRRLLKKGEDPSLGDYDERTPLHMAAAGMCGLVLLLLLLLFLFCFGLFVVALRPRSHSKADIWTSSSSSASKGV
jgi:hypothetical protein